MHFIVLTLLSAAAFISCVVYGIFNGPSSGSIFTVFGWIAIVGIGLKILLFIFRIIRWIFRPLFAPKPAPVSQTMPPMPEDISRN